mmetsp:Transcript_14803/g.42642  ORF Transcript_14803/g.42642 Transcript_14803/m.42642 type:complete len:716 (-) Transcript_14803:101-2248(-)|eukprot:CAMPEP_0181058490 /NCGR_PEP_ID=MMETSP1070-20121207/20850_1 /TAXON_ID=265543 /ORGANISM="Minutocellus polymorphus, Strain NH13" /LENGTH=715 /DNA_ID=CAMNT_0023138051 /DNA_START=327 /DNA_END=2474 /DNA_ORIENTATION=-
MSSEEASFGGAAAENAPSSDASSSASTTSAALTDADGASVAGTSAPGPAAATCRPSTSTAPASPAHDDDYHEDEDEDEDDHDSGDQAAELLGRLFHRMVTPTDLPKCYTIESDSYPPDEAASLESLQYRQHHAAPYFRCAALLGVNVPATAAVAAAAASKQQQTQKADPTDSMKMTGEIVGFVTGTRCSAFDVASMIVHNPHGSMLAIHSVVVSEQYRRMGVGAAMLREYVASIRKMTVKTPIDKIVLIAKADKLAFYVRAGFSVVGVSPIVHGRETWYECSCDLTGGSGLAGIADLSAAAADMTVTSCADPAISGHNSLGALGSAAGSAHEKVSSGGEDTAAVPMKPSGGAWSSLANKMACGKSCFIVDSFADPSQPGSGNPAAVVYMGDAASVESVGGREEAWMRTVAMEFSLSETAFLWQRRRGDGSSSALWSGDEVGYDIRYYTKGGNEVNLCGHATLAAASVVLRVADEDASRPTAVKGAVFYAKEDVLKASIVEGSGDETSSTSSNSDTTNTRIVMDFPWRSVGEVDDPADKAAALSMLQSAFGLATSDEVDDTANADILYVGLDNVGEDLLVELTPDAFDRVGPAESSLLDIAALKTSDAKYSRGIILCCRVSKDGKGGVRGIDFLSRFFGPKAGIDEDPVTGSAHCTLGPYFGAKIGRSRVVGRQASSRGGIVECVLMDGGGEGEGRPRRVSITGTAVTTVCGNLLI